MTWALATFLLLVLVFHASEVWLVYRYNRALLSLETLLLSPGYVALLLLAVVEYELELRYWPWLKPPSLSVLGATLALTGELIRKLGMLSARHNFTHRVAQTKLTSHRLVTSGIYRYIRHPGYLGWLLWATGMHLLLANPLSTLLTAVIGWRFLSARIADEESKLAAFFPGDYACYRERTPTFIPFVR